MAVATVLSASPVLSAKLLDPVGGTFAQNIAAKFGEASPFGRDALIASGLVLFVITLLINTLSRLLIWSMNRPKRSRTRPTAAVAEAA
jgi:phosphate transport system permease protein